MRGACFFVAALSLTGYVIAQQPASPPVGRSSSCPIALHVQIDGRLIARSASDSKNGGEGALLNLNFGAKGSLKVAAAVLRNREVEDEVKGTTFKHRIAEIHAISMKRLSKVEAADDPTDGADDE